MRPSYVTVLLLALASVAGCKKESALESASTELPEGEKALSPSEVRAYVAREEAKRRKEQRQNGKPGSNQTNSSAGDQGAQAEPTPTPEPSPTPSPAADPSPAGNEPWSGALIEFDGSFILLKGRIEFGKDNKTLVGQSAAVLDEVAKMLEARPGITEVELQAHVHSKIKGNPGSVTKKQADAARNYLRGLGIDGARVTAKGYGAEMPIDTNRTEAGRSTNMRVEVVVKSINGSPTGN